MKMKRMKKALSCILCMVLIVAMALVTTGCSGNAGNSKVTSTTTAETVAASEAQEEAAVLGEGSKQFRFGVVDLEGKETWFEIHTDEEMVGAALQAVELIEGDAGPYGLYVKMVNGITADYNKDKVYWAFYVNDDYGMSGVDVTPIKEGEIYSFRIAK